MGGEGDWEEQREGDCGRVGMYNIREFYKGVSTEKKDCSFELLFMVNFETNVTIKTNMEYMLQ